jgi:DNA-binding transcriptional LysR family regulator
LLASVDLNLLICLRVLLVEQHVTRSAERLGITQPAMSASLARLRTLFRDQLLVRGPKGLVLTPRAEQLLEQLSQVMAVIEPMIALPAEFVPENKSADVHPHRLRFRRVHPSPLFDGHVGHEAPNLQILFRTPDPGKIPGLMASGELDLPLATSPRRPNS